MACGRARRQYRNIHVARGDCTAAENIAFLLDKFSLAELFDLYQRKFAVSEYSFALRSLTYFDDAEDDPMPEMVMPMTWIEVKRKIESAVREFVKRL